MITSADVAEILGGKKILRTPINSFADLESLIERGLPVKALNYTVEYVTPDKQSRAWLMDRIIPRVTRRRRTVLLSSEESEKLARLARVMKLAEHVWENHTDAQEFMAHPHPMLNGRTPLEATTATELGARQVEDILWKLEYSLPV